MSEYEDHDPCAGEVSDEASDEIIDKIHKIQEEIFEREDSIDDLADAAESEEALATLVAEGEVRRRRRRLARLRADWETLLANSRATERESDFELAAALVHFVGDLLLMQTEGADAEWIAKLEKYLEEQRIQVN